MVPPPTKVEETSIPYRYPRCSGFERSGHVPPLLAPPWTSERQAPTSCSSSAKGSAMAIRPNTVIRAVSSCGGSGDSGSAPCLVSSGQALSLGLQSCLRRWALGWDWRVQRATQQVFGVPRAPRVSLTLSLSLSLSLAPLPHFRSRFGKL